MNTSVAFLVQTFNVLCVTTLEADRNRAGSTRFHRRMTGLAELRHVPDGIREDFILLKPVIMFYGKTMEFIQVCNGLDGVALCLLVKNGDETWKLYTDTPSAKPDRPEERVTREDLHERAERAIKRSGVL